MTKPMGMMSGCYFVGREVLLDWINTLLCVNYTKVEDTSNGAAFCQVIDCLHPGTVNLGRVKFDAYQVPDIVNNFKVLQDSFDKNGITQHIDVDTLTKGKYMASLELFQWMHGYFNQRNGASIPYDAVARRKHFHVAEPKGSNIRGKPAGMPKRGTGARRAQIGPSGIRQKMENNQSTDPQYVTAGYKGVQQARASENAAKNVLRQSAACRSVAAPSVASVSSNAAATKEINNLKKQIEELSEEVEQSNQERNFYYEKLRKIEIFCQDNEEDEMVKRVLDILYEADEQNGFVTPEDEEED